MQNVLQHCSTTIKYNFAKIFLKVEATSLLLKRNNERNRFDGGLERSAMASSGVPSTRGHSCAIVLTYVRKLWLLKYLTSDYAL